MLRVVHVITGLEVGGAEMMLYRLVTRLHPAEIACVVVSLQGEGEIGRRLRARGVPVHALGMRPGVPDPLKVLALARLIRRERADVVQTWMYHADLVGGLAARLARVPVAWCLQNSTLDPARSRRRTRAVARACAWLSRTLPSRIVSCSHVAVDVHVRIGYARERMVVIPNAFDLDELRPLPGARDDVRRELGVPGGTALVGSFARFDPQKDHPTLAAAAGLLCARRDDVRIVLTGRGMSADNVELRGMLEGARVTERVHLLGLRDDVPRLMAAMDLVTTSSASGEALPLVVGEAMACGVPCVVTDVGDSAHLVGDTGRVAPPRDPEALARAWEEVLALAPAEREALGRRARQRIALHFDLRRVAAAHADLYRSLAPAAG